MTVQKNDPLLSMDFPSRKSVVCLKPNILDEALGVEAMATLASRDLLVILGAEFQVKNLSPDISLLSQITEYFAVIVSSKGGESKMIIPKICIVIGGILSLFMVFFHTRFYKLFDWSKEFEKIECKHQRM